MFTTIVVGALSAFAVVQQADTTIPVREGMRLDLQNRSGEIHVTVWQRDAVRIVAGGSYERGFSVEQRGSVLRVSVSYWRERRRDDERRWDRADDWDRIEDFEVTVPPYMDVDLRGNYGDITVVGTRGDVRVDTNEGEVDVRGGDGFISLRSVEGTVQLEGARGRIDVSSVDGDVEIRAVSGEITVESVDGDIDLTDIRARSVMATTVDGDVTFDGDIQEGGRYELSTHDGDIRARVPSGADATVTVSTYEGEFETNFPIVLRKSGRRRFTFTLGDGSATFDLEAFDGSIFLRRGA
jgi:hypothetical protein